MELYTWMQKTCFYFDSTCFRCCTDQCRCSPPTTDTGIGFYLSSTDQLSFSFHLKNNGFLRKALYIAILIGNGSNHRDHIRTIGTQGQSRINSQYKLFITFGRHILGPSNNLAIQESLSHNTTLFRFPGPMKCPDIHKAISTLKNNGRMTNPLLLQQRHLHKGVFFVHNDTYTITVGINHYILGGKRSHGISYIHHRPTISLLQVQVRITLAHHHVIGILWLTEHIHQSSPERVRMITTLVVKRMPQGTSYMPPRRFVELINRKRAAIILAGIVLGLANLWLFTPFTCHTAVRIVGIPVIHTVTILPGKAGFACIPVKRLVLGGCINYIISHCSFALVINGSIATRSRILFMSSPIGILCKRLRKSRLIKYRFPQKDRRMITVSTDHITDVGKDTFFKHRFRIPVLPAGSGQHHAFSSRPANAGCWVRHSRYKHSPDGGLPPSACLRTAYR